MRARTDGLERIVAATVFDAPASSYTTFRAGGPAWAVCRTRDLRELEAALRLFAEREVPYRMMGKGSNLLFPDEGFAGVLVYLGEEFEGLSVGEDGRFSAGAGLSMPKMANMIAREGLGGLEFSAQIPGSVGGGVAVNAGAFNQELHSRLVSVRGMTRHGARVDLPACELSGSYRTTALKGHQDLIVLEATFQAVPGDPKAIQRKQREYGIYREKTQPLKQASAGCVFKNPGNGCSAGALIDRLGMKGLSVGAAEVSTRHANFIVNRGGATSRDIVELINRVRERALAESGTVLEPEIELVGDLKRSIRPLPSAGYQGIGDTGGLRPVSSESSSRPRAGGDPE